MFVRAFRRVRHSIVGESEEAIILKEIRRQDPTFDQFDFVDHLEEKVITNWVQAFLRMDTDSLTWMKQECTQAVRFLPRALPPLVFN